jgi:hypothetical protein
MKALKVLATVLDRIVWMVGVMAIFVYARDHWPRPYTIATCVFLLGFGVWYLWKFVVQPFRAGLTRQ